MSTVSLCSLPLPKRKNMLMGRKPISLFTSLFSSIYDDEQKAGNRFSIHDFWRLFEKLWNICVSLFLSLSMMMMMMMMTKVVLAVYRDKSRPSRSSIHTPNHVALVYLTECWLGDHRIERETIAFDFFFSDCSRWIKNSSWFFFQVFCWSVPSWPIGPCDPSLQWQVTRASPTSTVHSRNVLLQCWPIVECKWNSSSCPSVRMLVNAISHSYRYLRNFLRSLTLHFHSLAVSRDRTNSSARMVPMNVKAINNNCACKSSPRQRRWCAFFDANPDGFPWFLTTANNVPKNSVIAWSPGHRSNGVPQQTTAISCFIKLWSERVEHRRRSPARSTWMASCGVFTMAAGHNVHKVMIGSVWPGRFAPDTPERISRWRVELWFNEISGKFI